MLTVDNLVKIVMALIRSSPPIVDKIMSPAFPYLEMNHTSDAKQRSGSGKIWEGIQVAISIKIIVPQHIVTSYLPLAWNGIRRKDRKVHSRPNTNCIYGTIIIANLVSPALTIIILHIPGHMNCAIVEQPFVKRAVSPCD